MNYAYWHLALNHLPVLGVLFGWIVLAVGWLRKSPDLVRVALWTWLIVALLTVPAYLTGLACENQVMPWPGVFDEPIQKHRDAATVAFIGMLLLGLSAIAALIAGRRTRTLPAWSTPALFAVGLVITVDMAWTANLGGHIHHPELESLEPPPERPS